MPKLTPEESREIGGASAQIEKQQKAAEARAALDKIGKSAENVTFTKVDKLGDNVRVVGESEGSAAPKPQLSSKPKPLPKAKPKPTVGRGAGGRIVSLKKTAEKPVSKRKQTRTGKKIDRATGKIAVPLVKRGEGGRAVGTTAEERQAAVTTNLPVAGPGVMGGAATPRASMRTAPVTARGQSADYKGFARNPVQVGALLREAMGHLEKMKATHGTPEFHEHHNNFNAIHSTLSGVDTRVHTLLGLAAHAVRNPSHPDSAKHFDLVTKALRGKLSVGSRKAASNIEGAREGQRAARAARIAAEQAKKEGNT
jgi:hypothetical protein